MPVEVHQTPNPNARKYVLPGMRFSPPRNYSSAEAAKEHPLAAELFALDGVYNVFLAQDFVTINKRPNVSWESLSVKIEAVFAKQGLPGENSV